MSTTAIKGDIAVAYEILLAESQRARIERALKLLDDQAPLTTEEKDDPNLEYLTAMFVELPENESENPGITHGLCL